MLPRNSNDLNGQYLSSHALGTNLPLLGEVHMRHLLRLWFMQGIPFAFEPSPFLYEAIREWLAPRLGVAPLDITLIGSARIGYSPSPAKFSAVFNAQSDLDLAVISKDLFDRVRTAFLRWQDDCDQGKTRPLDKNQEDNLKRLPINMGRGFIDTWQVPTAYEEIRKVEMSMHLLKGKLKETPNAPAFSKASIRVYETRDAFEQRLLVNLKGTQQSLKRVVVAT